MTREPGGHVLVVGSLNVDLVMHTPQLPRPGETIVGGTFHMAPGGRGESSRGGGADTGGCHAAGGRCGQPRVHEGRSNSVAADGGRGETYYDEPVDIAGAATNNPAHKEA